MRRKMRVLYAELLASFLKIGIKEVWVRWIASLNPRYRYLYLTHYRGTRCSMTVLEGLWQPSSDGSLQSWILFELRWKAHILVDARLQNANVAHRLQFCTFPCLILNICCFSARCEFSIFLAPMLKIINVLGLLWVGQSGEWKIEKCKRCHRLIFVVQNCYSLRSGRRKIFPVACSTRCKRLRLKSVCKWECFESYDVSSSEWNGVNLEHVHEQGYSECLSLWSFCIVRKLVVRGEGVQIAGTVDIIRNNFFY